MKRLMLHENGISVCWPGCNGLSVAAQTHTPVYLAWIKKISYVAYGYSGLVKNEFENLSIHTTQVTCWPAAPSLSACGHEV